MESVSNNITRKEFDNYTAPMALDLRAFFVIMEDDILKLTRKARRENWTPERFITEIENLI